jgi:hypothetical protein
MIQSPFPWPLLRIISFVSFTFVATFGKEDIIPVTFNNRHSLAIPVLLHTHTHTHTLTLTFTLTLTRSRSHAHAHAHAHTLTLKLTLTLTLTHELPKKPLSYDSIRLSEGIKITFRNRRNLCRPVGDSDWWNESRYLDMRVTTWLLRLECDTRIERSGIRDSSSSVYRQEFGFPNNDINGRKELQVIRHLYSKSIKESGVNASRCLVLVFEIYPAQLPAVLMKIKPDLKNDVFWDITPCRNDV